MTVVRDDNKIITISRIPACFQCAFCKLIESVKVHIRKQLARHVPEWDAFPRRNVKTPDDLLNKPHELVVWNHLGEKPLKNHVVYRVEKSSYVSGERVYRACPILAFFAPERFKRRYPCMRTLPHTR